MLLNSGCRKPASANWDVDLAIPVVNSSLNIKNFLSDTIFKSDTTRLLRLYLNREVAAIKLDSLIKLPDTTAAISYTMPFTYTLAPGAQANFFPPADLVFNIPNGGKLRRADIRKCLLNVKFSNDAGQPLDLVYRVTSATKNGSVFTITETIPVGVHSLVKTYDLSGYSLNLRGPTNNGFNTLVQSYSVSVKADAPGNALLTTGTHTLMEVSYQDVIPEYVEGYFGQQTVTLTPSAADLGITQTVRATNFMLSEATLNLKLLNELGVEFNGSLENIRAINSVDAKTVTLQTSQLSNMNINRATRQGNVVRASVKQFAFNNGNSNLAPFISALPNQLAYQGTININPLGNISGYNDFAYYNTGVRLLAEMSIPLKFNADYFTLTSKADVDFSGTAQLDNVRGGNFVIIANNGYPLDAQLQAYMLDAQQNVIDSLFVPGTNTLARGTINGQNLVVSPVKSKVYVPVNAEKISHLKKCKQIRVNSKFLVPPGPETVKILETYQFDLNIVAELTYNVSAAGN